MKTLQEAQAEVIEDFSMYDEWLDKYEYLIDLGHRLPPFPKRAGCFSAPTATPSSPRASSPC